MTSADLDRSPRFPVLALLHPRAQTRALVALAVAGALLWGIAVWSFRAPVWVASAGVLGLLLLPGVMKWLDDRRRYGPTAMMLSMLLAAQGFHTTEHISQVIQYHLLKWPPFASSGLISAANAEWVHFVWNWAVVAA